MSGLDLTPAAAAAPAETVKPPVETALAPCVSWDWLITTAPAVSGAVTARAAPSNTIPSVPAALSSIQDR